MLLVLYFILPFWVQTPTFTVIIQVQTQGLLCVVFMRLSLRFETQKTYIIILTVTDAHAKRNFSKLKMLKNLVMIYISKID